MCHHKPKPRLVNVTCRIEEKQQKFKKILTQESKPNPVAMLK